MTLKQMPLRLRLWYHRNSHFNIFPNNFDQLDYSCNVVPSQLKLSEGLNFNELLAVYSTLV
jgi:hypothetical protein